jgi:hypothetical protein
MTTGTLRAMAGSHSEFTAGELLGMTRPSAWVVGKNESLVPNCSPKPRSRIVRSSPAGKAVEDFSEVGQGVMDLRHVAPDHDVRKAAGAGKGRDVLIGGLGMSFVPERQGAVEEKFTGLWLTAR